MRLDNKGFTLVEMIIVTAIFVVVIIISGDVFKTILTQTMKLYKSEESNIQGVVGLEMFRHDLEQAGFGLPDSYQGGSITYTEAGFAPAISYNDASTTSGLPRPIVADNNLASGSDTSSDSGNTYNILPGTDYLAIKATSLGLNDAAQKWTYINYSSIGSKPPKYWSGGNFNDKDLVIVLRRTFQDSGVSNQLVTVSSSSYWTSYSNSGFPSAFSPAMPEEIFYAYGIRTPDASSSGLRMPFNRVDYFVAKPSDATKLPKTCAPSNTGVLYKAAVNHSDGKLTYMPILDCVADMQVVLGWDLADASGNVVTDPTLTGDGQIDTWSNADGSVAIGSATLPSNDYVQKTVLLDPAHIKTKLKVIKIYLLAQNGRMDPAYTSPAAIRIGELGEITLTKPATNGYYNLTSDMLHYRWKVYRLVIKPKNLISNQQ